MARNELQVSFGETESKDETFQPAGQSALTVLENDSDLRRKSFSATMLTRDADQITNTVRSVSANGACSNEPSFALSIHRAPKAAFQDAPYLHVDSTGDNKKR